MSWIRGCASWPLAAAGVIALSVCRCGPKPTVEIDPTTFSATVLDPAAARFRSLGSWLARGKIDCQIDGRRGRGRIRVILVTPHQLRADIELSGFFGLFGARSVLWAGEEGLVWKEGNEAPAPVDADALFSPVLGGAAQVRDLEGILLGLAALGDRWREGAEICRDGDIILAAPLPGGGREIARVAGSPAVLRRLERRDGAGRTVMAAEFDHHRLVEGLVVPGRVEIRGPGRKNRIKIEWRQQAADWPGAQAALDWPEPP